MDLGGVVDMFGTTMSVARHRPAATPIDPATGKANPGTRLEFKITGSLQPLTGKQVMLLRDELERVDDSMRLLTSGVLEVENKTSGQLADRVAVGLDVYEVTKKFDWHAAANYGEYVVTKVK